MSALICGSLAYDTIMVFPDQFKNHILPDKVHILNVSFLVPRMRREFGGCAGNIAYNLKLLGGDPIPMATVGQDFGPYREWFDEQGIRLDQVKVIDELFTPQAFITTDHDNNQITAFHPGAMMRSYENHVKDVKGVSFGIVSPDGREGMPSRKCTHSCVDHFAVASAAGSVPLSIQALRAASTASNFGEATCGASDGTPGSCAQANSLRAGRGSPDQRM